MTSKQTEKKPDAPKRCFVICPIGSEGSEIRQRSDDIFEYLIKPVCAEFGIEAARNIDESRPGEITMQIIESIYEYDLAIADITPINGAPNPNVMYEVALRHASGMPCIHISENTGTIPFDIGGLSTIKILRGFGGVDATRNELRKHIRAIIEGASTGESPVSRYQDKVKIKNTGTPSDRLISDLIDRIDNLEANAKSTKDRNRRTQYVYPPSSIATFLTHGTDPITDVENITDSERDNLRKLPMPF